MIDFLESESNEKRSAVRRQKEEEVGPSWSAAIR